MGLDLNELRSKKVKLDLPDFPNFNVYYNPNNYTPEFEAKVRTQNRPEDAGSEFLCQMLPNLLSEWDLTDDGAPVPITVEALRKLPIDLLVIISKAIHASQAPFVTSENAESTGASS